MILKDDDQLIITCVLYICILNTCSLGFHELHESCVSCIFSQSASTKLEILN